MIISNRVKTLNQWQYKIYTPKCIMYWKEKLLMHWNKSSYPCRTIVATGKWKAEIKKEIASTVYAFKS